MSLKVLFATSYLAGTDLPSGYCFACHAEAKLPPDLVQGIVCRKLDSSRLQKSHSLLTTGVRIDWSHDGRSLHESRMHLLHNHHGELRSILLRQAFRHEIRIMVVKSFDPVRSSEQFQLLLHWSNFRVISRHNRRASSTLVGPGCAGRTEGMPPRPPQVGGCFSMLISGESSRYAAANMCWTSHSSEHTHLRIQALVNVRHKAQCMEIQPYGRLKLLSGIGSFVPGMTPRATPLMREEGQILGDVAPGHKPQRSSELVIRVIDFETAL
jgi:hypothetical protein